MYVNLFGHSVSELLSCSELWSDLYINLFGHGASELSSCFGPSKKLFTELRSELYVNSFGYRASELLSSFLVGFIDAVFVVGVAVMGDIGAVCVGGIAMIAPVSCRMKESLS